METPRFTHHVQTMKSMKTLPRWLCAAVFVVVALVATQAQQSNGPKTAARISGIRSVQTNLVVTVEVPTGVRRITLESRPRLGGGTWRPRAVLNPTNDLPQVTLTVSAAEVSEVLRVVTDDLLSLGAPSEFFQGSEKIAPQISATQPTQSGSGNLMVNDTAIPGQTVADRNSASATTVQESDIWKFSGDTL